MKRKFFRLSALLFLSTVMCSYAQDEVNSLPSAFDNPQPNAMVFPRPYVRPLTGIDIIRDKKPEIYGQKLFFFGGPSWMNDTRFLSEKNQGQPFFKQLDRSTWESNEWKSKAKSDLEYTINPTNQKVSEVLYKRIAVGMGNFTQKYIYKYDNAGNVIEEQSWRRPGVADTGSFIFIFKRTVGYDQNGRRSVDTVWNDPKGNIDSARISNRNTFTYNDAGKVTLEIIEAMTQTGAWANDRRIEISYDANNNLKEILTSRWNPEILGWEPVAANMGIPKETYSYDANGRLTENASYTREGDSIIPNTKMNYSYSASGNLKEITYATFFNPDWLNEVKFVFSEEGENLSTGLGYAWNNDNKAWEVEPGYRYVFSLGATDVEEISAEQILVSPNPAQDFVTLSIPEKFSSENLSISVTNELGETVATFKNISSEKIRFNRNDLPAGIYFYQIKNSDGQNFQGKFLFE